MKTSLRKLRRFSLVALGFLVVTTIANAAFRHWDRPWLGSDVHILILGDSHAKSSFDPTMIPGSVNVAQAGEPLAATYYKLRALLDVNPSLDTVVLSIGPHNLSWLQDRKFAIGQWAPKMYERYIEVLPWPTIPGVRESYGARLTAGLQVYVFPNPNHLINLTSETPAYPFVGGYENGPPQPLKPLYLEKRLPHMFGPEDGPHPPAKMMRPFLERIADLTAEHDIRLWLVRTPVHPEYLARIPEVNRSAFEEIVGNATRRVGVQYLDLTRMPLSADALGNHDHVCAVGAQEVSLEIAATLDRDRQNDLK